MTNYTRGVVKEREYVALMKKRGYVYAYRTAGSHSLFDVIAVGPDAQVYLTQIKRTKQRDKAHYLNAPACLQLQQFADNISYRDNKHVVITWAVWVDYRGWCEYTLGGRYTSQNAKGDRLGRNPIVRSYRARAGGWVWRCGDVMWEVVEGTVMKVEWDKVWTE